jgi:hypothetical protein
VSKTEGGKGGKENEEGKQGEQGKQSKQGKECVWDPVIPTDVPTNPDPVTPLTPL